MKAPVFMERLAPLVADVFAVRDGETFDQYTARCSSEIASPAIRAMVAAQLVAVSKQFRGERIDEKRAWILAARASFVPSPRAVCQVCGRYASLTHAHHIVPLAEQFERFYERPLHDHAWLCPTHHYAVHLLISAQGDATEFARRDKALAAEMTGTELSRLVDFVILSMRWPE